MASCLAATITTAGARFRLGRLAALQARIAVFVAGGPSGGVGVMPGVSARARSTAAFARGAVRGAGRGAQAAVNFRGAGRLALLVPARVPADAGRPVTPHFSLPKAETLGVAAGALGAGRARARGGLVEQPLKRGPAEAAARPVSRVAAAVATPMLVASVGLGGTVGPPAMLGPNGGRAEVSGPRIGRFYTVASIAGARAAWAANSGRPARRVAATSLTGAAPNTGFLVDPGVA